MILVPDRAAFIEMIEDVLGGVDLVAAIFRGEGFGADGPQAAFCSEVGFLCVVGRFFLAMPIQWRGL